MEPLFLNDPKRSLYRRCFYRFWQTFWQFIMLVFYGIRVHHQRRFPRTGASLICSNHQSNFDPIAIGVSCPRRVNFLAKKSLFGFPLGWIISTLDAIPIDRDGIGVGGIKETLRRLKAAEPVVLFPEGQRSWDGEMMPMMQGIVALVKRVPTNVVPVGIDGAFDAWPRSRPYPIPGHIEVVVGEPIEYETLKQMSDEQLKEFLSEKIRECFLEARRRYRRATAIRPSVFHSELSDMDGPTHEQQTQSTQR